MGPKTMVIRELIRYPVQSSADTLYFEPGVNVIVGPPNTGKTQWLKTLDHLLGDESPAEESLAEEVFEKYQSASLKVAIGVTELTIERHWKEPGLKTKIIMDGEPLNIKDFSHKLFELLNIPIVHYPQGDPYGSRSWPELGWRSLLRHIYRQQRFWSEIADRQPDSEQHACLMQFLGIARNLFSAEYGALVNGNKRIEELKLKKEHSMAMLQEISRDLIEAEDIGVALTPQTIELTTGRIKEDIQRLQERRNTLLESVLEGATPETDPIQKEMVQQMGEELASLRAERENLLSDIMKADDRLSELNEYQRLVSEELSRISRTERAGEILKAIKITHCPACDREISQHGEDTNECVLCHRPMAKSSGATIDSAKRIEFERHQLRAETDEAQELIASLVGQRQGMTSRIEKLNGKIGQIEANLRPTRKAAAAIMPPEIGIGDMEVGRLEERLQQLRRIASSLKKREEISAEIMQIQQEVTEFQSKVAEQNSRIDFDKESDVLADWINTYLNLIHGSKPMLWSQKPVAIDLRRRDFKFFVGERSWRSKLGGTAALIFLMAYHYGLMGLSNKEGYNYPGLVILDFPAELDDGSIVRDKENFVLEPFVKFLQDESMSSTQLIAAGSAFENLRGAHRIELSQVWK
jgi:hypothetical protein